MFSKIKSYFFPKFNYKNNVGFYQNLFIIFIYIVLPFIFFQNSFHLNSIVHGHGDALAQFFPNRQFLYNSIKEFSLPLWTPLNYAGMPFLADIQNSSLYFVNIIPGLIFPIIMAFNITIFIHYSLAGIFTYFFVKEYKISSLAAFTSGLIFMFSGFMIIRQTHSTMIFTAVWLPLILILIRKYAKTKNNSFIILGSIFLAQQFFAGNPQIFLYCCCIEFIYIIYIFFSESDFKEKKVNYFILKAILIFIFGFLLMLIQLLPTYFLMAKSFRAKFTFEEFSMFSFKINNFLMLFFPYIFGKVNPEQLKTVSNLHPIDYMGSGMYLGTFTFFISIVGFFKKNKDKYFWGIIALVSFLLIFGKNLPFYKLTYYLPLFNIFRIPSRHWVEFCFSFAILGGFGFDYILKSNFENFRKKVVIILAVISSVLISFFSIYSLFKRAIKLNTGSFIGYNTDFLSQSFSMNKPSVYIPLILIFSSLIVFIILFFLKKNNLIKHQFFLIPLIILIFFDLFSFGHDFEPISNRDFNPLFNENSYYDTYKYIKNDKELFRVFPVFFDLSPYDSNIPVKDINGNLNIFYDIDSIAGYQALYERDYEQITKINVVGEIINDSDNKKFDLISNNNIFSIYNTKYIIVNLSLLVDNKVGTYFSQMGYTPSKNLVTNDLMQNFSNDKEKIIYYKLENSFSINGDTDDLKLIQIPLEIKSNTYYLIKFKIKKGNYFKAYKDSRDNYIHFDFYGIDVSNNPVYDSGEQEYQFSTSKIPDGFEEFEAYVYSGQIPEGTKTFFRLYCGQSGNFSIKDLSLSFMQSTKNSKYELISKAKDSFLIENKNYLPRFYFAQNILNVKDIKEVEKNLWDKNYDPRNNTMIENYDCGSSLFDASDSKVNILKYANNYVDLSTTTSKEGFLVFSDTYYSGWRAYIDGKETKIYKVNGIFKGINVSAGDHKIRFRFMPYDFIIGAAISGVTFMGLIVFLVINIKKRKNKIFTKKRRKSIIDLD